MSLAGCVNSEDDADSAERPSYAEMMRPAVDVNSEYVCLAGAGDSAGAVETAEEVGSVRSLCAATAPVAVADSVVVG